MIRLLIHHSNEKIPFFIVQLIEIFFLPILIILSFLLFIFGIIFDSKITIYDENTFIGLIAVYKKVRIQFSYGMIILFLFGSFLIIIGSGIHHVANTLWFSAVFKHIDTYSSEFLNEIYFYDEILSHWLIYTGIYLLLFIPIKINFKYGLRHYKHYLYLLPVVILFQFIIAFFFCLFLIEGVFGWFGIFWSLLIIFYCLWNINKLYSGYKQNKLLFIQSYYVSIIALFFNITTILFLLIYLYIFKGFIQPSEWGFWCQYRVFLC